MHIKLAGVPKKRRDNFYPYIYKPFCSFCYQNKINVNTDTISPVFGIKQNQKIGQ